jgi:hypothetical protein
MKKLLITLCVCVMLSNAHAYTVSGSISGGSGLALRICLAIPTAFDTFYTAVAIPFLNTYSFSNLPEGSYYLMCFQDVNSNQLPEITEPRGMYGGTFAQALLVNQNWSGRNISIGTPTAGGFDGHLSYSGTQSNFSLIGAFDNPRFAGEIKGGGFMLDHSGNGDYFAFVNAPGTYYLYGILDVNGNYRWDEGEPIGYYGGMVRAPLVLGTTNYPHGVNITLDDIPQVPPPPVITFTPLADQPPSAFTITALIHDAYIPFSAKVYYRLSGSTGFDSLNMALTGNPAEYAVSLGPLAEGCYEYFQRATDIYDGAASTGISAFTVGASVGAELAYDDGGAEMFNWSEADPGFHTQWAVKFGPVQTPYRLYGARVAVSRSLPDTLHSSFAVRLYDVDGDGLPGNILYDKVTGSIGNVIGGLPAGTNWANIVLRDALGEPLIVNTSEFYLAVSNSDVLQLEGFGLDTNGPRRHRSVFYDPCAMLWHSEDDTLVSSNAHAGNRLIRATGFPLVAPTVVIARSGNSMQLSWNDLGSPYYRVYSSTTGSGETYLGTTNTPAFTDTATTSVLRKFYAVRTSTLP